MEKTDLAIKSPAISAMQPHWSQVVSYSEDSPSCFTLRLAHTYPTQPPRPGQFNMLYAFAVGEVPISVSRMEDNNQITVHTIRDVGAVTHALRQLRPGDPVGVRGPFGSVWPIQDYPGRDIIILAGGIGLAPVRPIIDAFLESPTSFSRLCLYYGARSPQEVLYREELAQWEKQDKFTVITTVDAAQRDWKGRVGFVTDFISSQHFDPQNSVAFICGPEIMMLNCAKTLIKQGLVDERIFVSMERNMKCAVGWCGHCQYGGDFICKDGPVFQYPAVASRLTRREY